MAAKIRVVEITEHGVHLRGEEVELLELADGTTREVRKRGYAKALGVNDFDGEQSAMLAEAERLAGANIAGVAAQNVILTDSLRSEKASKEQAITERDDERRAKEKAISQRDAERQAKARAQSEAVTERNQKQAAIAERNAEREAKRQLEQAVLAERAEKAKIAEQLEKANAERDQLLLAAQSKNDPSNAGRS